MIIDKPKGRPITEWKFEGMVWPEYHCGLCRYLKKTKDVPEEDRYHGKGEAKVKGYCYKFVETGVSKTPNPISDPDQQLCGSFTE